ncbi:hypothetical protein QBC41DRAFT_299858 [Cercophora samala]|uniref:Carrier domain-containing protein n=1 Tax=Cercophora samala TaxID=330535 RepID=A0AA39ZK19_9PEZI|nr:hypothetical protein QBC41DRAFT_299858 [Cercophora samala]
MREWDREKLEWKFVKELSAQYWVANLISPVEFSAVLEKGQTVLIHYAASASDQAAIKIAQHLGAVVFALVKSRAEKTIPAQLILGLGDGLIRDDNGTGFAGDRKFELRVVRSDKSGRQAGGKTEKIGEVLSRATALGEAAAAVEEYIKLQIAVAIGVDVGEVDGQKPLPEFGEDSLKAVEIRNLCLREMQSDISVFELLSSTPVAELAVKIATKSGLVKLEAEGV